MPTPNIYKTITMLEAMEQLPKVPTFLKNRYFPTDEEKDMFQTETVMFDIKDGVQTMAPVVIPRKKGITVSRKGYETVTMRPPLVAPQRILTVDDLENRIFGEVLYSGMTDKERESSLLGQDIQDLADMHTAREEYIAAQCMINNGYILPQYADDYGSDEYIPYEIRFYKGNNNPSVYVPANPWGSTNDDKLGDMRAMVRFNKKRGKPTKEFLCSADMIDMLYDDDKVYKLLDNRRMELGSFKPEELPEGAAYHGHINIDGIKVDLFSYVAEFQDDLTGVTKPVLDPGTMILTAPNSGRGLYGAVKQIESSDGEFHTYAFTRVPKYVSDVDSDIRKLRISARPMFAPRYANPWLCGKMTV